MTQYQYNAHRARASVECLHQVTQELTSPDHWPPNSPILHLIDYKVWGCLQRPSLSEACTWHQWDETVSLRSGQTSVKLSLMKPLMSEEETLGLHPCEGTSIYCKLNINMDDQFYGKHFVIFILTLPCGKLGNK